MLQSQTAVLERNTTFTTDFASEPFEVAWAREARWYFQVLEGGDSITLFTQVSPDGINWVDLPEEPVVSEGTGMTTWPVREFGHWLRIRGTFSSATGRAKVRVYLALKS